MAKHKRYQAAGRPPTELGDLTVTSLTVIDPEHGHKIRLEATNGGLQLVISASHDQTIATVLYEPKTASLKVQTNANEHGVVVPLV